jgi:FkbM family methyltransferase
VYPEVVISEPDHGGAKMFGVINSGLKRHAPRLQNSLKRISYSMNVPLPKVLWGRPVWTHARLWNHVVWDDSVLRWINEYLKPGGVFFDVGAHQGWLSIAAAWRTGRKGKVVAFEPSPALVEVLRFHKRMNRLNQMEIVTKAVTRANATVTPFLLEGDGDSVMNSLVEIENVKGGQRGSTTIGVEAITLDSFSEQTGFIPTMIKIDTEGSEIWVCQGARNLLAKARPALIVATHPAWLPDNQKIEDLFALLSDYGYRTIASDVLGTAQADFRDYLFLPE